LENNTRPGIDKEFHGTSGPNIISDLSDPHASITNLVDSISASLSIPKRDNLNGKDGQIGVGLTQTYTHQGARFSAADAYLNTAVLKAHANLIVRVNSQVTKLVFKEDEGATPTVTGVTFKNTVTGKVYTVKAKREVVLSAGAVNTPQLLMLSGIGPKTVLEQFNIKAVHINEAVGKNLKDHPNAPVAYKMHDAAKTSEPTATASLHSEESLGNVYNWLANGRGPLTSNIGELNAFFQTKYSTENAESGIPDMQMISGPVMYVNHGFRYLQHKHLNEDYTTIVCVLLRPESTGYITLSSANANDAPKIHANYFEKEIDVKRITECLKKARSAFNTLPMSQHVDKEVYPGIEAVSATEGEKEDKAWADFIRTEVETLYHPTSTCRMGKSQEDNAVVSSQLKVFGVHGLRIADASVMPEIVRGNTNAACIMIGEKAADLILAEHTK